MSGKLVHFEIPFDDGARARAFYAETFGWQLMEMPEMDYTMVMTGPSDPETGPTEPGFINGGMFQRTEPFKGPNIVIDVADIDETLKTVEKAGGKILQERQPVGEMGFAAYFHDSESNVIGLWQSA
jgi:predicted enzyme related to lactoylglutathione lyase